MISLCRKFTLSDIDIRRKNADSHLLAVKKVFRCLCRVIDDRSHERCHKLNRIIALQPRCLHGNNCIRGSMGFIKCVFGKVHHGIVDAVCGLLIDSVCHASFDAAALVTVHKALALRINDILLFLTHRTPDVVRLSHRVAGKLLHDLHNLFLINDTTVCRLEDRLEFRCHISNRVTVIFSLNVIRDKIHRTRTVQ